ncbi:hypothetical protein T12_3425, partial [Trichinella patagoniensis]
MPLATEEVIAHHHDVAIAAPSFFQWLPQVHPHLLEGPANRVEVWSHLGSILFPFGPTVHLLVVVL